MCSIACWCYRGSRRSGQEKVWPSRPAAPAAAADDTANHASGPKLPSPSCEAPSAPKQEPSDYSTFGYSKVHDNPGFNTAKDDEGDRNHTKETAAKSAKPGERAGCSTSNDDGGEVVPEHLECPVCSERKKDTVLNMGFALHVCGIAYKSQR